VEKACREFVTLFLQVLDDGRLTDGQGRVVDFRNTVIIMTSNLGAAYLQALPGGSIPPDTRTLVMGAIEAHFPPEFRNRIDEIIIYRPLSRSNIRKIVDIRLAEFAERLAPRKLTLKLDDAAKDLLGSVGYSPTYGARPLNRAMQEQILNPLAMMLLQEKIRDGEVVGVGFDGPTNRLVILPNHRGVQLPADQMDVDDDELLVEEMD
jgi:ATP-dependent Clp protease ATP-binding subunit ClpB